MARGLSLTDYHEQVVGKIAAEAGSALPSRVGVEIGYDKWLVELGDITEVVVVPRLTPVPHTRFWFAGIANVRGVLYSVIDTSAFFGGDSIFLHTDCRVLLVHPRFGINCALIVSRMLGLRNPSEWEPETAADQRDFPWQSGRIRDPDGVAWRQLHMAGLVTHPDFLQVARQIG